MHTVLERLRKKGYLTRERQAGVYRYLPCQPKGDLLASQVEQFVQRTLEGSLKPFAAYLARAQDMSDEEIQALKAVVATLDARQRGG
jgi:predicted transcriptional regulator